jgi:hypothetical protein
MTITSNDERVTIARVKLFEAGLQDLRDKVAKLNKRAVRHGMVEVVLRVVSSEMVDRRYPGGKSYPTLQHDVEIDGCEPCINGFRLLARVEFNPIVGTLVHANPAVGDDCDLSRYRSIEPICEHCNSRRNRNDVFVLAGPDGHRKIVGRNCLADYIRSGDAETLARWADMMDSFVSSGDADPNECCDHYDRGRANPEMALVPFLRIVAMVKRRCGWLGRTKARDSFDGIATVDIAGRVIYGCGPHHERWMKEMGFEAEDGDADYAEKAAEWAAGLDCNDSNEYRYTIGQIGRAGAVDLRKLDGYAASILIAYDMDCERAKERAEKAKTAKNTVYFGSLKKREKGIRVTCKGVRSHDGYYGVTTIIRFEFYPDGADGADKAVLCWFASGDRYNEWTVDEEYTIDATPVKHEDHERYGKQTKINRVKAC